MCDVLRKGLKAFWIIVDVTSCLCGCEVSDVMKVVISSFFVWTCHLYYSDALVVTNVMCIEKEWVLKRMYHLEGRIAPRWILYFEGRIARRDGYYIEGRVVRRDRCMDRYVPYGSRTERQRVCITRSDMHNYTWHCIPLHCIAHTYHYWTWYCDLLIL